MYSRNHEDYANFNTRWIFEDRDEYIAASFDNMCMT